MKSRIAKLTILLGIAVLAAGPGRVQAQVTPEEHAKHHPEGQAAEKATPPAAPAPQAKGMAGTKGMNMMAADARLDELVAKMNAAQGQAKVDAIAEVVTALVQQHQAMHGNMSAKMSEKGMMGAGAGGKK